MRVALVSSCTNRKKLTPSPELQARSLPDASLQSLASEWTRRITGAASTVKARDLYAGRAFTEAGPAKSGWRRLSHRRRDLAWSLRINWSRLIV